MCIRDRSPLYTESDIIDMMRREGIGRPSTYAIILDILFKRGYIKASPFKKKIFPLKRGITIYNILTKRINTYAKKLKKLDERLAEELKKFITVEGTRELEREMDEIEKGGANYQDVLLRIHMALKSILKDLRKYYRKELLPRIEQKIQKMKQSTS